MSKIDWNKVKVKKLRRKAEIKAKSRMTLKQLEFLKDLMPNTPEGILKSMTRYEAMKTIQDLVRKRNR